MSEQKTALVTGAARGIGRAIAKKLASCGMRVVINYNGSREKAEELKREIEAEGGSVVLKKCNVSDYAACEEMFKELSDEGITIDVLVNNAGITKDGLIIGMSPESFNEVLAVNLGGAFNCTKLAAKQMIKKRYGRIVNISSVSGVKGNAGQANYSASKAGIIGLTKSCSRELCGRGINVNAVAPGFISSDMTDVLSDKVKESVIAQIPKKRFGTPEDIAEAVAFLASDKAEYITGQVLCVDGGMAM